MDLHLNGYSEIGICVMCRFIVDDSRELRANDDSPLRHRISVWISGTKTLISGIGEFDPSSGIHQRIIEF
jgi:hypothetical protein